MHILVEELLADHEPASSKYVDVANAVMYINMYTYVGPNYLYMHLLELNLVEVVTHIMQGLETKKINRSLKRCLFITVLPLGA